VAPSRLVAPVLAVALAACPSSTTPNDTSPSETGGADTAGHVDYASWTGTEVFEYGLFQAAGIRKCSLWFDTTGTPSDACPDCVFAFDVTLDYRADRSTDDGTCADHAVDATWTYGYFADYQGQPMVGLSYGGTWYAWAPAGFDRRKGRLTYEAGWFDEPLSGDAEGWYYTYGWSGEALLVQEG